MFRTILLALTFTFCCPAVAEDNLQVPVDVVFEKPESFTDARTDDSFRKGASESVTRGLSRYLERTAPAHLTSGQSLQLTFTDIDLAGDFEPGTNLSLHDVRLVKSIYPPRLVFRWTLLDGNGAVLRQGEENIRDLGFQTHTRVSERDPLRYEKRILKRWLQDTLPREG